MGRLRKRVPGRTSADLTNALEGSTVEDPSKPKALASLEDVVVQTAFQHAGLGTCLKEDSVTKLLTFQRCFATLAQKLGKLRD